MDKKHLPCPTVLRQLLTYDSETGKLFWRERPRNMFCEGPNGSSAHKRWNARYAHKPALDCVRRGIRHGSILGKSISAHRAAWAVHFGKWPDHEIDHINGDPSDNRIINLRDVSHGENLRNMRIRSDNTSGVTGVSFHNASGLWAAQISIKGKMTPLGTFSTIEEAKAVREEANKKWGFHKNHGTPKTTP